MNIRTPHEPQHGTFAVPSLCSAHYVRDYFREGNLPPDGTVCEFVPPLPGLEDQAPWPTLSGQDEDLLTNLNIVGRELDLMGRKLHVA